RSLREWRPGRPLRRRRADRGAPSARRRGGRPGEPGRRCPPLEPPESRLRAAPRRPRSAPSAVLAREGERLEAAALLAGDVGRRIGARDGEAGAVIGEGRWNRERLITVANHRDASRASRGDRVGVAVLDCGYFGALE